ncbi:MAG: MBL fold metallo-hydrolase [Rhodospirillaceae bacterium]|nr:MBL fold metallo-hydrolase [Rhodospirillaceae bacterium]MBT3808830.1 MBL fold metallo-hydrolase [Rhodospirillaceae bacterium]MBT3931001.1 MBL fold metallo-hydrolase [Rhodospirillaceae bacterium]MBT4772747.1 MBL fold metallo-hydrolase [Rhodospirillaceae bacterium]MBT5359321.1 MBL fold metallo-hydrolase [Rhodospirillaceae bacterium]
MSGSEQVAVEQFTNGIYRENAYIVGGPDGPGGGPALLIDPGSDTDAITGILDTHNWRPAAIICTHAHFDHVGAVAPLMARYDIPFYLHRADEALLKRMNLYKMVIDPGEALKVPEITHDLTDVADITIAGFTIEVLPSPGHTPGGVCLRIGGELFTGDTVLPAGVGRIDLPGGDGDALEASVAMLNDLPRDLTAHPGHGASMALGDLLDNLQDPKAGQS